MSVLEPITGPLLLDPDPGEVVVAFHGDVDIATAPDVRSRLGAAMGGRGTALVIDLSGVSFIDCSGLRELVAARSRLVAGGRSVVVRSPSPAVLRLLRWTAMSEAFGMPVADRGDLRVSA